MKNETDELDKKINDLRSKRIEELEAINEQFRMTYESLKPINLLKSTLKEVSSSPDIKNTILAPAIGLGFGFLCRKILVGNSHNPAKRLFGTLVQFAIANVVAKHGDSIKSTGQKILYLLINKRKTTKREISSNGVELINK